MTNNESFIISGSKQGTRYYTIADLEKMKAKTVNGGIMDWWS